VAAFRNGNHSFEDILGYGLFPSLVYTHGNVSEMLNGVGATPNAMEFWGVPPLLGRGFGPQDVQAGAPPVVLLIINIASGSANFTATGASSAKQSCSMGRPEPSLA
jgi:hypothetical protein